MSKYHSMRFVLVGLLITFCYISLPIGHINTGLSQLAFDNVDLVSNWNFSDIEPGGWEGNDHNASKPCQWYFSGDTEGPKEHYQVINDTDNGGDSDTLFVQPTHTNKEYIIMFWQDFTPIDINKVTIQHRSRAMGPNVVILLYGLNDSIAADTPLPNSSMPCLAYIHPQDNNETPGYWPTYTNYTTHLTNLNNTHHHYRIHWQVTEWIGKPDAELYITYCRVTESQPTFPPLPPIPLFPALPLIGGILIVVVTIIIIVIFALLYLKQEGKLRLP